jgi:uncharacterized membrane protein
MVLRGLSVQQISTFALAALTAVVTQVVAYVPQWAQYKQEIIGGGGIVLTGVVLVAGAIHHLATAKNPTLALHAAAMSAEDKLRSQISASGMTPVA